MDFFRKYEPQKWIDRNNPLKSNIVQSNQNVLFLVWSLRLQVQNTADTLMCPSLYVHMQYVITFSPLQRKAC